MSTTRSPANGALGDTVAALGCRTTDRDDAAPTNRWLLDRCIVAVEHGELRVGRQPVLGADLVREGEVPGVASRLPAVQLGADLGRGLAGHRPLP